MKDWQTILRNRKLWTIAAALVAGYLLTGFLLLPWLAERYVPRIASEQLQRPLTLGKVRFNPILFKLELNDVALTEPQGEPLASLGRLFVDFELSGLFRRAFAFRAIELDKLRLHPQIGPDARLNFARLADAFPPPEKPEPPPDEKSELPRLLVDHFALIDSAVEFSDLSKEPGVSERMESINFKLDAISTLPDNEASHHFTAAFEDGSALDWHGQVSLNPIASEGELKLEGFKLATPWPFVKDRVALEPPEGQLTAGASYRFRMDRDTIDLTLNEIAAAITGLKAVPVGGKEPVLAFEQIQLGHGTFSLADQAVKIPEFALRKGVIKAAIDERGAVNWQQLVKPAASPAAAPASSPTPASPTAGSPPAPATETTPAKPWHVDLEAFRIEELALQLIDASRQMPLDASIGAFGLGLKLAAEAGAGEPKVTIGGLTTEIRKIGLRAVGAKDPALALETFRISDGSVDLAARTVSLPAIALQKGSIRADVDARGVMNWQQFATPLNAVPAPPSAPPVPKPAAKTKKTKTGKAPKAPRTAKAGEPGKPDVSATAAAPATAQSPWRVNVDALKIEQIGIHYADDSRRTPLAMDIGSFGLGLRAAIEAGAGAPKVLIDALQSEIKQIALRERQREKPLASLESIAVGDGKLDLAQNTIGIQQITLSGGATAVERDEKGAIRLAEVFSPRDEGKVAETVKQADVTAKQEGKPWQMAVGAVNLNGFQAAYQDRSVTPPFVIGLRPADFHLKNVANFGKAPVVFDGKIHVVQGGDFSITGQALTTGERGQAELRLDRLALTGLQPYVAQVGALKLESGNLSTHLKLAFEQKAGKLSLTAKGEAGSADLMLKEAKTGKRFASWEKLDVNGIEFSLTPDKLAIREINVSQPGANFEIFEDRSTNVAAIFAPQPGAAPKPGTPSTTKAAAKPAAKSAAGAKPAAGKPFPFSVQRVKVEHAIFDFSDQSLVLPFKTRIQNFGGTISGISNAPGSRTLLKLDGRVDEYGEANLEGTLDLMQHKAFSDITLIFRNVEMSSLSPYSGTFAGRQIQSGKLNAELQYKIENSHMKSNGKIELDQVALGSEVVSPKAKSLPLDMALALLKDSAGKISVSVPIEGNVDDPQFAYGPVIWNAIATLITKVVTAPFTALASVFGNGDQDMGEIFFIPGKNGLPPAEIEKLKKLAAGLGSRPGLVVKVTGTFDPKLDAEALKSWDIRTAVTERLGIKVAPGEDPGPVAFDSAKSQKALEDLADEAGGAGALAAAQTAFREQFGREPKRIGGLSSWMEKASEDAQFYQLLFERLVQSAPLPPNALEALGDRRGQAVIKELIAQKGVDRSRVHLDKPASTGEKDGRIPVKLDLAADG
ncbi:DUF748 domain-containing protein [Methylolobus aquaticus]|nr:DUF748 domain-containing protein [Methylolobus aquaticus]